MLMFLCSHASEHFTLSILFAPRREITRATSPRSELLRLKHLDARAGKHALRRRPSRRQTPVYIKSIELLFCIALALHYL